MTRIKWFAFFVSILIFAFNSAIAQTNHLNKKITLKVFEITTEEALILISRVGDFNFSYNAEVLNGDSIVSINVRNKTVEKTLNTLFNNSIRYKVVNEHVILLKNNTNKKSGRQAQKSMNTSGYTLSGYVLDATTGLTLPNATVYEVDGKVSAITNSQGFYMMVLPPDRSFKGINYCRYDYLDSIVFLQPEGSMQFDISLKPRQTEIQKIQTKTTVLEHDLESRQLVTWLVPEEAMTTAKNITIPERTTMQISLLPFIGSDYKLSGTKTNNVSLNVLAGYTGSVDGVEIGSLVNIVQNNVNGTQLAGFGNIVGKDTRGAQLAGFFNVNNGSVTGAQIAGFQNTLNGEMHGAQLSGFNNFTTQNVDGVQATGFVNIALKDVNMAQLSGFVNVGRNIGGVQGSGFVNIAYGDVRMAQITGYVNYCDSVTGVQMAGFVNVARLNVTAAQLAGFVNYSTSVNGAQLAGFTNLCLNENKGVQLSAFINYASTLNGVQLAVFNFSDTVKSGVPIGFLSFVRTGYHEVEFYTNETFTYNASFKTGLTKFYNIFGLSRGENNLASFTYGLGFQIPVKNKHAINFDITYATLIDRDVEAEMNAIGYILKFNPQYNYNFHKYFTVFAGPSFNFYSTFANATNTKAFNIANHPFWEKDTGEYFMQMWAGLSLGVRL